MKIRIYVVDPSELEEPEKLMSEEVCWSCQGPSFKQVDIATGNELVAFWLLCRDCGRDSQRIFATVPVPSIDTIVMMVDVLPGPSEQDEEVVGMACPMCKKRGFTEIARAYSDNTSPHIVSCDNCKWSTVITFALRNWIKQSGVGRYSSGLLQG